MTRTKISQFVDLYPDFHRLEQTEQILRVTYFHTIEELGESVNRQELEQLFRFARVQVPKHLQKLLAYLCGKGEKLLHHKGEYSLRREVTKAIEAEVRQLRGKGVPPKIDGVLAFDFPGKTFGDKKIAKLLEEAKRCYSTECWNACGLLIRIIIERTLDSVDATVKAKVGLRDKINYCRSATPSPFSKSVREGLEGLQGAKIIGDIAAHHSSVVLDQGDINIVLPAFRMLLKEITI